MSQFDSSIAGPSSNQGWVDNTGWPDLRVERLRPGCATLDAISVVAGGLDSRGDPLRSVEIIFLASKTLGTAKAMLRPRSHFNLIAVDRMLMAFGGFNETSIEMWGGMGESWQKYSSSLASSRSSFSALVATDQVCSNGPLPPHSCPTVDGGTCVFPFANGNLRLES